MQNIKKIFLKLFLVFLLLQNFKIQCLSSDVPPELIDLALDFVENPSDFFFNIHHNTEDISPLYKKHVSFRTNLFPCLLPFTLGNLSFKARFNKETKYIPQFNFSFGYGKIFVLEFLSSKDKPESNNYYYSFSISKKYDSNILFLGIKYSESLLRINFSENIKIGDTGSEISNFDFKIYDLFYYSGILIETNKKKNILAHLSYGPKYKKIVARLGMDFENLEIGLDIFPEGLFVFHPYWAYHWRF